LNTGIVKYGRRSTYVARKIDDWMDGVIKDPNLAPNHSFPQYLKSQLLDRDVPERISDAITRQDTGHRAQIRACENDEEVQGDQQTACNTPGGGVAVDPASRGVWAEGPRVHNLPLRILRLSRPAGG
jgi:hypothetical protein